MTKNFLFAIDQMWIWLKWKADIWHFPFGGFLYVILTLKQSHMSVEFCDIKLIQFGTYLFCPSKTICLRKSCQHYCFKKLFNSVSSEDTFKAYWYVQCSAMKGSAEGKTEQRKVKKRAVQISVTVALCRVKSNVDIQNREQCK